MPKLLQTKTCWHCPLCHDSGSSSVCRADPRIVPAGLNPPPRLCPLRVESVVVELAKEVEPT